MKEKREHILEDPEKYRQEQIARRLPEDFDELPEEEQQEMIAELEDVVVSYNPADLREEIGELGALIRQAKVLEEKEQEVKVRRLKALLTDCGVFEDPNMKLLIFTEHKDTLDFLVGDGRDGRPMGKLREWNLTVTQIHGGMKIGDRDTPGTPDLRGTRVPRNLPGARSDRGGRRGHQPAILLADGELRHPVEPGEA